MPAVELLDISTDLGGRRVVDQVSLFLDDGELVALVGPSGSGKTTLLRLIAGLIRPASGRIRIAGTDVTDLPAGQRGVSMVFQEDSLYQHLSVRGNLEFPLRIRGDPKEAAHRRAEEEARRTGIRHLLGVGPRTLSAGQRSVVATTRGLVREAGVLLLDEPLARADAMARVRLRAELRRLHDQLGVTTLLCTNDQVEAMALADRVAVLDEGRLQQVGSPRWIYDLPANVMVARFIGLMNLFPAQIGDDGRLEVGHDRLRWTGEQAGRPVLAGIRPEHLREAGPQTPFDTCLHVFVGRVEDAGSHALVQFGLGAMGIAYSARLPAGWRRSPGDRLELEVETSRIRLFDARSGVAI